MTATETVRFDRMPEYKALADAQRVDDGPTQCSMLVDWLTEWCGRYPEDKRAAFELKQMSAKLADHYAAVKMAETLKGVHLELIAAITHDRHCGRKEQAAWARELFKRLGLKRISVTTPMYSMASGVDIRLPKMLGEMRRDQLKFPTFEDYIAALLADPVIIANKYIADRIKEILAVAFPNHDDRSDYQSDYFDSKWSVD